MPKRLICAILCIILIVAAAGCKKEAEAASTGVEQTAGYRKTVLYYPTDSGYIVPVMKYIPWEEGIGKAALSYLADTEDNRLSAAQMGLKTVIPDGVTVSLRIRAGGAATVDLAGFAGFDDAASEQAMVTAIVNTLTEFPTVETVQLTLNGRAVKSLDNGTDISKPFGTFALNQETGEVSASTDGARPMTLYFPNAAASLNIPVTRYTALEPTLEVRIASLLTGPAGEGLLNCFPAGTTLIGASVENNIATVEFSSEFAALSEEPDMLQAAYDSLYLTAAETGGVYALDIYVEGELFDTGSLAVSVPMYPNEFR